MKFQKKTVKEIKELLAECGMVSRSPYYSHEQMRLMAAKYIIKMQKCELEALIATLQFY